MKKPRLVLLLLFPIVVALWLAGWTTFWAGSREPPKKRARAVIIVVSENEVLPLEESS